LVNVPVKPISRRRTPEGTVTLLKTREPRLLVTLRKSKQVNGEPMSQRQVAKALKLSAGYYADLELGNRHPSYEVGLRIAAFYDLSLPALFDEIPLEYGQPA
jgi:transcriptional regulator with XRE-family HTH domain